MKSDQVKDLKECPFCGKANALIEKTKPSLDGLTYTRGFKVVCGSCGSSTEWYFTKISQLDVHDFEIKVFDGFEAAKEAWNKRAE